MLLSLATEGKLPWSLAQSDEECRRTKESCDILKYARELGCEEVKTNTICAEGFYFILIHLISSVR